MIERTPEIMDSIKLIVSKVHDLTHDGSRFGELDDIYATIDIDELEVVECISYIRTAYRCKDYLQQWYQFTDKTYHKAVEQYGEKRAERIFVGLR